MVCHYGQLINTHLPCDVQPCPDSARHQQSVNTHDFVIEELSHMADDARARGMAIVSGREMWILGSC
jgi:hypothetical protein